MFSINLHSALMLDILKKLDESKKYAITCLPEQSSALRAMQEKGYKPIQIEYILGPYTGTALYPEAIRTYLRSKKIKDNDEIKKPNGAGAWPGYLEIKTKTGKYCEVQKLL